MKTKNGFRFFLYIISIILLLIIGIIGYLFYNYYTRSEVDKKKYPNYVGYIDQEKALLNKTYLLCDDGGIYKTHHGAPKDAFIISKKHFRESILSEYKNLGYTDSAYLNFRFLVNCEGNPGWFEIIEMNLDLEKTTLNNNMVNQLLKLTANPKHWDIYTYKNVPRNYYMYISYRIENGEITEILP